MAGDLYKVRVVACFITPMKVNVMKTTLLTVGTFCSFTQAQQSLDLIQGELSKVADNADDLIENSSLSSQRVSVWGSLGA